MKHTLETDGITLEFQNRKILSDIYLKCETGKITGLLGRNGQGKSCLMKIIYGTLRTDYGSVRLDKMYNVSACNDPKMIRYLPQGNFIPGHLSLRRVFSDFEIDFVKFGDTFSEFTERNNERLDNLSGGGRRLVEVYVILKSQTRFVLLDEPFTHLMPVQVDKLKELIEEEKENKGILLSDHMYRYVIDICDDLYVLSGGKTHLTKDISDLETLGYARLD